MTARTFKLNFDLTLSRSGCKGVCEKSINFKFTTVEKYSLTCCALSFKRRLAWQPPNLQILSTYLWLISIKMKRIN